jgi:hypothetical protein
VDKKMNPNPGFFFVFPSYPMLSPQLFQSWPAEPLPQVPQVPQIVPVTQIPQPSEAVSPSPAKKYKRTWKKDEVEEVFTAASRYCQQNNKQIEDMTLEDFSTFSSFKQTPEQMMKKVNEINKSQTLRPGIWSSPEDDLLISILRRGLQKWGQVANLLNREIHKGLKIRTGKMCKERWNNYLNPSILRGPWTEREDIVALEKYKIFGNKWSSISKFIENRTESSVKNRIKSLLNRIRQDLSVHDDLHTGINRVIKLKLESSARNSVSEQDSVSPRSGDVVSVISSFSAISSFVEAKFSRENGKINK